ncbi:melatonin receptor type 1A-like [Mizuhopecten yessoensis]|uniref:Melatonin receptor type 1A n=1 Tax=Mizuhopecten yessoensis TaxID=6573 RepID=A0A210QV21_MIZYE|nr:melatonin receptor type 1A-like [Mizuhopecten yessoensis]OWF52575.1 Melatonin receptor type 1A [Mizuhopecten yessoensis]
MVAMEEQLDPIFELIIQRQVEKGYGNYTADEFLSRPLEHSPVQSILFLLALSISSVTGLIGNILVIGAVIVSRRLRTTGNMFIVNLAVADIIIVTIVEPFNILGVIDGPEFFVRNVWWCHTLSVVCVMSCSSSMMNLAAISVNRYIMINKNHYYNQIFTKNKTFLLCVLVWFLAFLIELPNLTGWGGHTFDLKTLGCSFDRLISLSYTIFLSVMALWLPLLVIMFCYLNIYFYVKKSRKQMEKQMKKQTKKEKKKTKRQRDNVNLARTFFIVFLTFLICWTPYDLTLFFDRGDRWPSWLYTVFLQIGHFNSSLNSILYGATNRNFRDGYKQFLQKVCCSCKFRVMVKISGDKKNSSTDSSSGYSTSSDNTHHKIFPASHYV